MAVEGSQRVKDVAIVKWAPQPSPLLPHPYSGGEADDLSDAERLTMLLNGSQSAERRQCNGPRNNRGRSREAGFRFL